MSADTDIIVENGVAAGPHPEASAAGADALKRGGNAVDAAVAAVITLCVVLPDNVGLGGYGGLMVIYLADEKRVVAVDFDARAPLDFRPETYAVPDAGHVGYLSVSVPGVVAGLALALDRFGTMSWRDVSERAVHLAEEGFEMYPRLAASVASLADSADQRSLKALLPDGVPKEGDRFVQKDLARLIRRLGEEGPMSFYAGDIPAAVVRQVRENGGILTENDFTSYSARMVEPIRIEHRGCTLYSPPIPSGSLTGFQVLRVMELLGVSSMQPWTADYFHLVAESIKVARRDRVRYFGDPDFVDVPVDRLLSDEHIAQMAEEVQAELVPMAKVQHDPSHTVHVVASDRQRNVVSLTATHGELFGSRVVIEGLGLVLGHGMSRFDFDPDSPNYPAPGKRMQHNMCPVVMTRDGLPYCAVGLPGGPKIVSVMPQLVMNLLDFETSVSGAIAAPRVHTEGDEPLLVSSSVGDELASALEQKGHQITLAPTVGGPASGLIVDASTVRAASEAGDNSVGVV